MRSGKVVGANIGLCRLNTLLELKLENERLQQHLSTLRAHSQQPSTTHAAQHMGSYTSDDLSTQLAANLGLPARSTAVASADSSRSHYSLPPGYEPGGGFPAISSLEDEGDAEPRRKKVRHLHDLTSVACCPDTPCSQLKKSVGGEQYICNTCGRTDSPEWRKVNQSYSFSRSLANFSGL
jgi:hypothetical protein